MMDVNAGAVDIVAVDYRKGPQLADNLRGLVRAEPKLFLNIVVVDNSESKENRKILEKLRREIDFSYYPQATNTGYVRACNLGATVGTAPYILLLNSDIQWMQENTLYKMVDYLDHHLDVGIIGPRQINNDGSTEPTIRRFPNIAAQIARRLFLRRVPGLSALVARYEAQDADYSKTQPADWLQSSCLLIRRALWHEVGGLDPRYFIFMSDSDICFKCWKYGKSVVYLADAVMGADGRRASAGGIKTFFTSWILRQHLRDAIHYQFAHAFKSSPRPRA